MAPKFKVLVVDDDEDKLNLLAMALNMAGYDVLTAGDGQEALKAMAASEPDLVISDVMMPRMNGFDLARRIRQNPKTKFIPVILQTAGRHLAEDLRLGSEVGALGYITDPTDLELLLAHTRTLLDFKAYLDTCEEAAFTDHLTGLANRRRFERQLEREVARTMRYGHPFCLLMLDIDHFKNVNDTHGHETGDIAMKKLAKILQEETRGIDLAARIGGEEFGVILTETCLAAAVEVAERLRIAIKSVEMPTIGTLTASFGVAECPSCATGARQLLACADAALYKAKNEGRDRVACWELSKMNSAAAGDVLISSLS
jgi:diguanylate cyclase (GGDEF)-like protein